MNTSSLEALYTTHVDAWIELAREAGIRRQDAQDVVHDAMVTALERLEYVHHIAAIAREGTGRGDGPAQFVEPDACGTPSDCFDLRCIVYAQAAYAQEYDRDARRIHQVCREQLRDFLRTGWGSLPSHDQLTDLELRVDVQRAVDTIPSVSPVLVWRYLQGDSVRNLSPTGTYRHDVHTQLHRAWDHCRGQLEQYRGDRKHWGNGSHGCAG